MTEKHLNHLILLRSYKQCTDEVDITEVAEDFVERKERRSEFFLCILMSSCLILKSNIYLARGLSPYFNNHWGGAKAP